MTLFFQGDYRIQSRHFAKARSDGYLAVVRESFRREPQASRIQDELPDEIRLVFSVPEYQKAVVVPGEAGPPRVELFDYFGPDRIEIRQQQGDDSYRRLGQSGLVPPDEARDRQDPAVLLRRPERKVYPRGFWKQWLWALLTGKKRPRPEIIPEEPLDDFVLRAVNRAEDLLSRPG